MAGRDERTGQQPGPINWQEAVLRLSSGRHRAESLATLLKQRGEKAAVERGALIYGEGKTEIDAIINGLLVALARREEPTSVPELEARLQCAVDACDRLSTLVRPLLPDQTGEKDLPYAELFELAVAAFPYLADAIKALIAQAREADSATAETIRSQLETTRWRAFSAISTGQQPRTAAAP